MQSGVCVIHVHVSIYTYIYICVCVCVCVYVCMYVYNAHADMLEISIRTNKHVVYHLKKEKDMVMTFQLGCVLDV
jgi:hypothetical protein